MRLVIFAVEFHFTPNLYFAQVDVAPMDTDHVMMAKGTNDKAARALSRLNFGSRPGLVSMADNALLNDYDPRWFLAVHPVLFPNGTGVCPKGMKLRDWVKLLLERNGPHAQAVDFQFDAFNVITRHRVYQEAFVQTIMDPAIIPLLASLTSEEIQRTTELCTSGFKGKQFSQALDNASDRVKTLYKSFKMCSARIEGSPQSFASLRSQAIAHWHMGGAWTCSINLNPFEGTSPLVMRLAGHEIDLSDSGEPTNFWPYNEMLRSVARSPAACALFFKTFMRSFVEVFLGWPMDANEQKDPNCPFGEVSLVGLLGTSTSLKMLL